MYPCTDQTLIDGHHRYRLRSSYGNFLKGRLRLSLRSRNQFRLMMTSFHSLRPRFKSRNLLRLRGTGQSSDSDTERNGAEAGREKWGISDRMIKPGSDCD